MSYNCTEYPEGWIDGFSFITNNLKTSCFIVAAGQNVAKLWPWLQKYFRERHKNWLVFISNVISSSNTCLNMLSYRSFSFIATVENLVEIIILKLLTPWILEQKKNWLHRARQLTHDSLFMVMVLLLPLLVFWKTVASRPTCVDANTNFWEGGQIICSEHLFIFIKNIFTISSEL